MKKRAFACYLMVLLLVLPLVALPQAYAQETDATLYETVKPDTSLYAAYDSTVIDDSIPEVGVVFGVVEEKWHGNARMGRIGSIPFGSQDKYAGKWLLLSFGLFINKNIKRHEHQITDDGGGPGYRYTYKNEISHEAQNGVFRGCKACGYRTGEHLASGAPEELDHVWEDGRCRDCGHESPRPVIQFLEPQDAVIRVNQPFQWRVDVKYPPPPGAQSFKKEWWVLDGNMDAVLVRELTDEEFEWTPPETGEYYLVVSIENTKRDYIVQKEVGFTVVEKMPVVSITLSPDPARFHVGESLQLTAEVKPDDAEEKGLEWKSDKPDIVSVDAAGKITARRLGTATITATALDGFGAEASCQVKVDIVIIKEIILTPDKAGLQQGKTLQIYHRFLPLNATPQAVRWESSDINIATVSDTGLVTGVSLGTAIITATTIDGVQEQDTCALTVTAPSTGIKGDANNDGKVDLKDLFSLVEYLVKGSPCADMDNADADGSGGEPNAADFVWIVNHIVK